MIDITKQLCCDNCDATTSITKPKDYFTITLASRKKIKLCWNCLLELKETIEDIVKKEGENIENKINERID